MFNYCIGFYYDNGKIGTYLYGNDDVFFGTLEDANGFLSYAKMECPEMDWRIFKLI